MQDDADILRSLACSSGISVRAMLHRSGMRSCVHARQVGAWLVRNLRGLSYPETAITMGRKHHTTMMHACKRVEDDIRTAGPRLDVLLRFIEQTREK